ncbi:hypothetical protein JYK02_08545 [Corallococcus macrosporus]|uniref:Uncharacterized protein n=1 Tax=Corallococcus macrosporus TaxID=35 RepID=A0ABS3D7A8_9BACT|nr:hypothetical protein [Corallococcus macrosporus]MBN8227554.1 hypothetical protein [Corallococcus macrosporus]
MIIFGEDGKYYVAPQQAYAATPLPPSLWAAPEFVVGLGAVAADLQSFEMDEFHCLTKGIACIVLNLASLVNDREKAGKRRQINKRVKKDKALLEYVEQEPLLPGTGQKTLIGDKDLIIFSEKGDFYWLKYDDYRYRTLPDDLASAPKLMVGLGAVLADIPFLPTVGCSCFLLNLASLKLGSKKAAELSSNPKAAPQVGEGQGQTASPPERV